MNTLYVLSCLSLWNNVSYKKKELPSLFTNIDTPKPSSLWNRMEKKKIKSFHLQRRGGINQKVSLAIQLSILTRELQIITIIYMYFQILFINIHDFRVWVVIMCLKHDMYYGSCLCWSNFIFIPSLFLSTGC